MGTEVLQIRVHEVWAAGFVVLALGFALGAGLQASYIWILRQRIAEVASDYDDAVVELDRAEIKIDRILRDPLYYAAQKVWLRTAENAVSQHRMTINPEAPARG